MPKPTQKAIDAAANARRNKARDKWLDCLGGPLLADSPHINFLAMRLAFPDAKIEFSNS
jgi:hypothetical protein